MCTDVAAATADSSSSEMLGGSLQKRRAKVRLKSEPHLVEEFLLLPPVEAEEDGGAAGEAEGGAGADGADAPPVSPRTIAAGVASAFNIVRKVSQRVSKKQGRHRLSAPFFHASGSGRYLAQL